MGLNFLGLKDKVRSLNSILRYPRDFLKFRRFGRRIWLGRHGRFARPEEISFGSNVFINEGFHISARNLTFGSNIMIGPNLIIECDDHVFDEIGVTMFDNRNRRNIGFVTIEDDVWIGANVTILKGVTIGEGAVVGAGSVVTKSVPPYAVCAGLPCRPIRSRFTKEAMLQHLSRVDSRYSLEAVLEQWEIAEVNR